VARGAQMGALRQERAGKKQRGLFLQELLAMAEPPPDAAGRSDDVRMLELERKAFEENDRIPTDLDHCQEGGGVGSSRVAGLGGWKRKRPRTTNAFAPVPARLFFQRPWT
jgi:hypothetical protein